MIWFFAGAAALLGGCGLVYWRWSKRVEAEIAEGAEAVWSKLNANDPELMLGLDRARFGTLYNRVHFPRYPGYALAAAATFVASLPVTLALLSAGILIADRFGLTPNPAALADRYLVEDGRMRIIRAAPPEAREVQRALNQYEANFYRGMERVSSKADPFNAYYKASGEPDYFQKDLDRYRAVTAADVRAAVEKYLPKDRRVELSVVPGDKK